MSKFLTECSSIRARWREGEAGSRGFGGQQRTSALELGPAPARDA